MDENHCEEPATLLRRKQKMVRKTREEKQDASNAAWNLSNDETISTVSYNTASEEETFPKISNSQLQNQSFNVVSNRKSKIQSIRDKSLRCTAARSSSIPKQTNQPFAPETYDFLRIARRSLSSPRCKEESSDSDHWLLREPAVDIVSTSKISIPVAINKNNSPAMLSSNSVTSTNDKMEENLRKFEKERRIFEIEKKTFECKKRNISKTHSKYFEPSNQRDFVGSYRKLSDCLHFPKNSDDKQLLLNKFLESQQQIVQEVKENNRQTSFNDESDYEYLIVSTECPDYESSTTTVSGSEVGAIEELVTNTNDNASKSQEDVLSEEHLQSSPNIICRRRLSNLNKPAEYIINGHQRSIKEKSEVTQKQISISELFSFLTIKRTQNKKTFDICIPNQPQATKEKMGIIKAFLHFLLIDLPREWQQTLIEHPDTADRIRLQGNKCFSHMVALIIFCGLGGLLFRFIEGSFENNYKCGVGRVKRDFIDYLWHTSHNLREEEWKSSARIKLRTFEEELHAAHESGMTSYSGSRSWNFVNSALYCWTIVSTIGYGHISPTTVVGRAVTIVYAIIGIPIFLILLADFGKLFTRCIKFLWAFVRRLYYTGTFRKLRKHQHVQQVMHGMNVVYEIAMRRPTLTNIGVLDSEKGDEPKTSGTPQSVHDNYGSTAGTPTSPIPETYMVDDEFNLPISVAIVILLLYIFLGAGVYCIWEDWTYFESVYFVFISMSTIGFGDFVPQHPIFMMCSIAYLMFGLALTSMCINVVQVKLSNSFRQASTKIGATIGFEMSDEEGMSTQNQTPIECASIYSRSESKDTVGLGLSACSSDLHHKHSNDRSPPPIPCRLTTRIHDKKKPKEKSKNVKKSKGNANNK